ncbi:glycoside hydrolase family 66 protein [Streptococcus macacae]|uniref:Dextranase n=1 Tax=Streptococcus macacae NCTC 11558 TaxID=764298 RepID=G5JWW3_9STRE|nr:glycoside hydrolase family 66 protein [Streptococcus macacae]EHJ53389.1 dextranase [Streptococcus macacae NCTC 11558]SUN79439.1 dextranase precursor [Streptococcus macacae NCTC 11558]
MKKNEQTIARMFLLSVVTILLFTNGLAVYADDIQPDTANVSQESPAGDLNQPASDQSQAEAQIQEPQASQTTAEPNMEQNNDKQAVANDTESAANPSQNTNGESQAAVSASAKPKEETSPASKQENKEDQASVAKSQKAPASSFGVQAQQTAAAQTSTSAVKQVAMDKAVYQPQEAVHLNLTFQNTTAQAQNITASANVYSLENKLDSYHYTKYLLPGESYTTKNGELTIPAGSLANNRGYLVTVLVTDQNKNELGRSNKAIAVETDWRTFPRYGVIGGSSKHNNSILKEDLPDYQIALEQMKHMNINSYFFYDAYKSATDPFPDVSQFNQKWNWWSHSKVETDAVKALVNRVHDSGAVAMLYNMILAQNPDEKAVLPESEYAYNYDSSDFGQSGHVMTYSIDGKPLQHYYNPLSTKWQDYIANAMKEAMKNGGFDGWQGDTIGDNRVLDYKNKDNKENPFMLSDAYASFVNAIKEKLPDYYFTLNDINGENIEKLSSSKQDIIYNELWPFGSSALSGRSQNTYGDLKARIDQVRQATGKSLVVGAYMEEPKFDEQRNPLNGAARDSLAAGYYQKDAVLLTTAAIAAAGGYHMSLAALANPNDGQNVGVLETAYYPTQSLKVSDELNRKNYDYQQFITAYENLLRDKVENDTVSVKTFNANGQQVSLNDTGVEGNQVWTYAKKGSDFRTIQLLNLMGITPDWKNEEGSENNKTPKEQTDLVVDYPLSGVSLAEANRLANQVYITSPDDWLKSSMMKVSAKVDTDAAGNPVLHIQVPRLTLWDMIYIAEKVKPEEPKTPETPDQPQNPEKPADPANPSLPTPKTPEVPVQPERPHPTEEKKDPEKVNKISEERPIPQPVFEKADHSSAKPLVSNPKQENELPQTGDKKRSSLLTAVGAGVILIGLAGFLSLRHKRK